MRLALVEGLSFARRLARRRVVVITLALDAVAVAWILATAPGESPHAALGAAQALGALTTLVLASGCIADDRAAGRLLLAATHPSPRSAIVLGRWLAVAAPSAAVTLVAATLIALAGPGLGRVSGFVLGAAAGCLHVAAFGALAVSLSTGAGATAQVLTLLGLLLIGLVPPDVLASLLAAPWLEPVTRAAWTGLPTPWALDRIQAWVTGVEGPHPALALALVAQPPVVLAAGARALARAELGARSL